MFRKVRGSRYRGIGGKPQEFAHVEDSMVPGASSKARHGEGELPKLHAWRPPPKVVDVGDERLGAQSLRIRL